MEVGKHPAISPAFIAARPLLCTIELSERVGHEMSLRVSP